MAYESFDNINKLELQAAIEAGINLFENSRQFSLKIVYNCFN
jgi:hypothetical protein